jgi:hypothetical protein
MNRHLLSYLILIAILPCSSFAQNRISLTKKSPIYLDYRPGFSTGKSTNKITSEPQWLNYTTLVHPADPTVSITVEIASGEVPDGMELIIETEPYVGSGKGKSGTPTKKIIVSHIPQILTGG